MSDIERDGLSSREMFLMRQAYDAGKCDGSMGRENETVDTWLDDIISDAGHYVAQHLAHDAERVYGKAVRAQGGEVEPVADFRAEIRTERDPSDEYVSFLTFVSGGKSSPYLYIPETVDQDVLDEAMRRLNAQPSAPTQGVPEVVAYPTKDGGISRPVDQWLEDWLEDCSYHEGRVYKAVIRHFRNIQSSSPPHPSGEWVRCRRPRLTGQHHDLKTDMSVFCESMAGRKPWEIRLNDRDFRPGDTVTLHETGNTGLEMAKGAPLEYTGRYANGVVGYVLKGPAYGIKDRWCVFSLLPQPPKDNIQECE